MAGPGAGTTSAIVMGGFLCLGLVFLGIASTIVLSLIPTFTSNHAEQGYGEEYSIDSTMVKLLSASNNTDTYNGSAIGGNSDLSSACSSQASSGGASNVAGCVLQDGVGYGPATTSTTSRRRRRDFASGLYAIYKTRLFFSTSCPKLGDKDKVQNSSSLSNCVKKRLQYCNKLINHDGTASTPKQWTSLSNSLVLSIYASASNAYKSLTFTAIYGFPGALASATAKTLGVSSGTQYTLNYGCRYVGPLPQATIASIIASQSTVTTTATTTAAMG